MTLSEAIDEVKRYYDGCDLNGYDIIGAGRVIDAIATILNAVVKGELS